MPMPPRYVPGDKIFAKVKGFPHWPARVSTGFQIVNFRVHGRGAIKAFKIKKLYN